MFNIGSQVANGDIVNVGKDFESRKQHWNKVYIAGSCKNKVFIQGLIRQLIKDGYEVTHDWTKTDKIPVGVMAHNGMQGIRDCGFFIFVSDEYKSRGKYFELGYACGLNKDIIIYSIGNQIREDESIFVRGPIYAIVYSYAELIKLMKTCSPSC